MRGSSFARTGLVCSRKLFSVVGRMVSDGCSSRSSDIAKMTAPSKKPSATMTSAKTMGPWCERQRRSEAGMRVNGAIAAESGDVWAVTDKFTGQKK